MANPNCVIRNSDRELVMDRIEGASNRVDAEKIAEGLRGDGKIVKITRYKIGSRPHYDKFLKRYTEQAYSFAIRVYKKKQPQQPE